MKKLGNKVECLCPKKPLNFEFLFRHHNERREYKWLNIPKSKKLFKLPVDNRENEYTKEKIKNFHSTALRHILNFSLMSLFSFKFILSPLFRLNIETANSNIRKKAITVGVRRRQYERLQEGKNFYIFTNFHMPKKSEKELQMQQIILKVS